MKKILGIIGVLLFTIVLFLQKEDSIEIRRLQHFEYLKNSPFKESLKLSKKERRAQGLPPNKYFEREWELTMNPATGKAEPEKVLALQSKLNKEGLKRKSPGDAVNNSWTERGPNNVGGRTRVLLFDPNDSENKKVFAGAVSGGLWVNENITNAKSTWEQVAGVPSNMNVSCLAVDPRNSNIWYLGTGEQYTFGAAVGNGVYKTTDGGVTWNQLNIIAEGVGDLSSSTSSLLAGIYFINDIVAWDNGSSTEVFVGVGSHIYGDSNDPLNFLGPQSAGLYRSTNDGLSWSRIENENMDFSISSFTFYFTPNDLEISSDNTLWMGGIATPGFGATGAGTIFNSTDGETWSLITTLANSNRVEIAMSGSNADQMYALTQGTTDAGPHIYETTNAFTSYSELSKPIDKDEGIPANDFTRGQSSYDLMIEVDPTNDAILYVGGIDLFRSANRGITWNQISKWSNNNELNNLDVSLVHADQHAMTFRPGNSNQAVFGNDGGVYYSNTLSSSSSDISAFRHMINGYNVTQFYHAAIVTKETSELMLAGAQDNGTHLFENSDINGPDSSFEIVGGDGAYCFIDQVGIDYWIASLQNNRFFLFDFNIKSWRQINDDSDSGDFINQADLDSNLDVLYVNGVNGVTNQIFRYSDLMNIASDGLAIKTVLSDALLDSESIAFKVSPYTTTSTTLLVGTESGKLLKIENADTTPVWSDISSPSFLGSISDIEFGKNENEILITFHNYGVSNVWFSEDAGISWSSKEGDLPDFPVKAILANPVEANEVIVGTELGVWKTTNWSSATPNWTRSFNGMQDVKVTDLQFRSEDNTVLASTFGRGLFTGLFFENAADYDSDSVLNDIDNCIKVSNNDQLDTDGDTIGDVCDDDDDNDGVLDLNDNSPLVANPDQRDTDNDGEGDASDPDDDNDGVLDEDDNCILKVIQIN